MTSAIAVYVTVLLTGVLGVSVLHWRAMKQSNPEYTLQDVFEPRVFFTEVWAKPHITGYSLSIGLYMIAFRYNSVPVAVLGGVILIGSSLWSLRDDTSVPINSA